MTAADIARALTGSLAHTAAECARLAEENRKQRDELAAAGKLDIDASTKLNAEYIKLLAARDRAITQLKAEQPDEKASLLARLYGPKNGAKR